MRTESAVTNVPNRPERGTKAHSHGLQAVRKNIHINCNKHSHTNGWIFSLWNMCILNNVLNTDLWQNLPPSSLLCNSHRQTHM